jgi:starch synthase
MKIAMAAAEVAPFAKTGGLGDVVAALGKYLHAAGHDVRPFLPLYGNVNPSGQRFVPVGFLQDVPISMGGRTISFSAFAAPLPGTTLPVHFVACPALYGARATYRGGAEDALRFAFLSRAAIECCQRMGFAPDVFHVHDWHTALVPLYLKSVYGWDRLFAGTRTVLTIHNVAYQGVFGSGLLDDLGLRGAEPLLWQDDLRAGRVGFLRSGILHAGAVTAVSRTYADEIRTPEQGMGLDAMLRARSASVFGIVNGIDAAEWDPETDPLIPFRYSRSDLSGKARCREHLLRSLGLAPDPSGPVLGVVSRLTAQKGFDLAFDALPRALAGRDVRLVALGSGGESLEAFFSGLAARFPARAHFRRGYDNALAHRIEAGADAFLMPSRFEPCGLNQMYSQRYGTVPIVRRTGGLADTVEPFEPSTGRGTGFVFEHCTPTGFSWALDRALETFSDRAAWRGLADAGMAKDFSWERRIGEYLALYHGLVRG